MSTMSDFKDFILRGNVVDLAVGVTIGTAFGLVVTAFTKDLITPLVAIASPVKNVDFSKLFFTVGSSQFMYGEFINSVISFLIVAVVIFFFVVKPVNALMAMRKTEPAIATTKECPECLSSIPAAATRCAFCTAMLPAA
jgi:large conductance mechanosensitive channel